MPKPITSGSSTWSDKPQKNESRKKFDLRNSIKDGQPEVFISDPYGLSVESMKEVIVFCELHCLRVVIHANSWWNPCGGTIRLEFRRDVPGMRTEHWADPEEAMPRSSSSGATSSRRDLPAKVIMAAPAGYLGVNPGCAPVLQRKRPDDLQPALWRHSRWSR